MFYGLLVEAGDVCIGELVFGGEAVGGLRRRTTESASRLSVLIKPKVIPRFSCPVVTNRFLRRSGSRESI
jgi:hypothetical protein